ncbi:MAG: acyl-CoA dehydrogenase, partial [Ignavibacteriales bacterium CG12_big_fil_rev_8_21_14_0_65_30_8]
MEVLKGGEFLIKESEPNSVFIPEELNEEQRMIVDTAREFIEKEIWPKLDAIDHQEEGVAVGLINKAGELGLLGTSVPEEYGGFGQDFNSNTALAMTLGTSHSIGVSFAAHTGIGTLPIMYYGTEEQKKKYLPKLA